MSSEVEEIKDRLSVVDLIGEYIRLTKAGSNWKALCPFHNEKSPSFMVSEERRSWHCFGCAKGGDIFSFVMEMEGMDFREALEMLAAKAGVELKKGSGKREAGSGEKEQKNELYKILELATKWYEKNLWEGKGKDRILGYLRERGLKDETIKKFRLGYAPDGWRNLLDFLQKKGFETGAIDRTGLLVRKEAAAGKSSQSSYDRFRDRIIFPVQDVMGRVVGFSARVAPGGDEKSAKYVNTPQTELYDKSKILYGLNLAKTEIKKKDALILVEGNMDVIASHQAGFQNTVAVSGTAFAPEQVKAIKRYAENVLMAFDMDAAGQTAAKRSAKICLESDLNVRIVVLPSGKDAADAIKEDRKIWQQAIASSRGVIDYFFEDAFSRHEAGDPIGKKKIARELLDIIKDISSPIEKAHWVKILAQKIGVEDKTLFEVLKKAVLKDKHLQGVKKEPPAQKKENNILEKRILGLLLAYPRETARKIGAIRPDDFEDGVARSVFEQVASSQENAGFEEIKAKLADYEAGRLMDEAVFEVEVETKNSTGSLFDPSAELGEAVSRVRQGKLKKKIFQIARDISEAERSGDRNAVSLLMKEFQLLSEEIKI